MARPKRGNYATGEAGLARYKEALRKYLAKTKKTTKAEVKKPAPKKPVAKKPVAKKPAIKRPGMTKAEKQEMLKGNSIQDKEKALKKTAPKKTVAKKPATKKPAAKKPVAKKPVAKKPATNLKIKKAANTTRQALKKAAPEVKKAVKTVAKKAGEAKKTVTKKAGQLRQAIKKGRAPAPKTPQQKAVSKAYRGTKKYAKTALKKGGKDLLKIGKGILKNPKSATKGVLGGIATATAGKIINRRVDQVSNKLAGRNLKKTGAAKLADVRKNPDKYERTLTGYRLKGTGSKKESSSPKKTTTAKTTKPSSKLKIAQDRVKKAKGYNKQKLQREVDYQKKLGKQGRTWSNPVGAKGKGKPSSVKTEKKAPSKKMHAIEKRNRARFGDAHVERLKRQHEEFKKRRKKK